MLKFYYSGAPNPTKVALFLEETSTPYEPIPIDTRIGHKGEWFDGEHAPIIDQATFDQVQQIMKANSVTRRHKRAGSGALLAGLVYDDHGNRMTPSFTTKRNVRYRFYVSAALLKGHKDQVGSLPRISGPDLEAVVLAALKDKEGLPLPQDASNDQEFINKLIKRIEVGRSNIRLILKRPKGMSGSTVCLPSGAHEGETLNAVDIAWQRNPHGPLAQVEESQARGNEPDPSLVQAVARAHAWAKRLTDGTHNSVESLAASINMHPKVVRKSIRLAFLAPEIIEAILSGDRSKSFLSITRLHDTHSLSWVEQTRQFKMCA